MRLNPCWAVGAGFAVLGGLAFTTGRLIAKRADTGLRVAALMSAARQQKDRLHALQTTEWNTYYAVWAIIIAFMLFSLIGSRNIMIDIGVSLNFLAIKYYPPLAGGFCIRIIRGVIILLFSASFYFILGHYYLVKFYKANYDSLVNTRTHYYFYLYNAINLAFGKTEEANFPPKVVFTIDNCPLSIDSFAKLEAIVPSPAGNKVKHTAVPPILDQLSKNYRKSETYRGRRNVMILVMCLAVITFVAAALLAPVKSDDHANTADRPPVWATYQLR